MCVVLRMNGVLWLQIIAIATIGVSCDVIYFDNNTITDMLYNVQIPNRERCPTLQGVIILMIDGTTRQSCDITQNIPIDWIAVKHLVTRANEENNSSQLIYLANGNGELTHDNGRWSNLSRRQWLCVLSQHSVAVLKPKGVSLGDVLRFTPLSLQTILTAEYMNKEGSIRRKEATAFSITPNKKALTKVVSYFIMETGWTRIGLLYDNSNTKISERFVSEGRELAFQVYPMEYDGTNAYDVYNYLRNENIRVIVFSGLIQTYLQVLDEMYDYHYTGIG